MKIKEYLLSFFVDAEKKTKEKYLKDLIDLHTKIVYARDCNETYESARILLYSVDGKLYIFEEIKILFASVNYGQHKFVVDSIDSIINTLRHLIKISYVANVCKIHKSEPLLSYVYINPGGRTMNDLATLKREDELTWTGDLEPMGNGAKIRKINVEAIQSIDLNLKKLITYIEN